MVCSKSCLWGSSEQPTGRGNAFSSKIAAAWDGLSASCKKHLAERSRDPLAPSKEIPAGASKGCCLRNSSCFPGDSLSLRVDYFQEFFLHPLSLLAFVFGGCIPVFVHAVSWQIFLLPQRGLIHSARPKPLSLVSPVPVQGWSGCLEMSSALSCRKLWDGRLPSKLFQSWKGERTLLKAGQPGAEWSPRILVPSCVFLLSWLPGVFYFILFLKGVD